MICSKCGKENAAGKRVCGKCGAALKPSYPSSDETDAPSAKRKPNLPAALGAILAIVSVFLTFTSVDGYGLSQHTSLFAAEEGMDWVFIFGAGVFGLVFSMTGLDIGAAVMGLTEIIICFLETRSMNNKLGALAEMSDVVKKGAGCYLLYAGGALLLIGGIIGIIIKRRKA